MSAALGPLLALVALAGCTQSQPVKPNEPGFRPEKTSGVSLRVIGMKRNEGKLFDLPSGAKPKPGSVWVEVNVELRNGSKSEVDLSELRFALDVPPQRPKAPTSSMVTVDKTKGLDSSAVLEAGGTVTMTVGFQVPADASPGTLLLTTPSKRTIKTPLS